MCKVSAEELFNRLTDKYDANEIVDILGMATDDLVELGIVQFIDDNIEDLVFILGQAGVLNEDD